MCCLQPFYDHDGSGFGGGGLGGGGLGGGGLGGGGYGANPGGYGGIESTEELLLSSESIKNFHRKKLPIPSTLINMQIIIGNDHFFEVFFTFVLASSAFFDVLFFFNATFMERFSIH